MSSTKRRRMNGRILLPISLDKDRVPRGCDTADGERGYESKHLARRTDQFRSAVNGSAIQAISFPGRILDLQSSFDMLNGRCKEGYGGASSNASDTMTKSRELRRLIRYDGTSVC